MRTRYALKKSLKMDVKGSPRKEPHSSSHSFSPEEEDLEEEPLLLFDLEVEGPAPEWVSSGLITPDGEEIMVRVKPFALGFLDFESIQGCEDRMDILPLEDAY